MTDKITYKEPTPEQHKLMADYADVFHRGMELILQCAPNNQLENVRTRLLESMQHFNTYVICGGSLKTEPDVKPEISPTHAANRILTMN